MDLRYLVRRRTDLFKKHRYRMKKRDTEAVVMTRRNAQLCADITYGMAMLVEGQYIVRFQGLREIEFLTEGDYLVRTIMPGEDYYSSMTPEAFLDAYEKVPILRSVK